MFKKIDRNQIDINPFTTIGDEWMLISAKKDNQINTMTASWGGMGFIWGHDVVTVYIRQTRYTKEFIDKTKEFSLSFFDGHKKELGYLGKISGRDENKIKTVDFHTAEVDGYPTFEEAKLVITAQTLYTNDFTKDTFEDEELWNKWYADNNYHTMYIAKVTGIYVNE